MTDPLSISRVVRPGAILFGVLVVLATVLISGYKITHPKSAASLTAVATVSQTIALQTTEPPTSIPPTANSRLSPTFLGTARYSDSVGDHVTLRMTSQPLVRSASVPSNVLSACAAGTYGDPNSTLYREVLTSVTVTSSLKASVGFAISRMNTPIGSSTNPIRSGDLTVILMLSSGPACQSPYSFMGNGVLWKSISPGQSGTLTVWLSYPNVISPDFPHGNATDLRDQSWLLPASLRINGNVTGSPIISGPGFAACTASHRFFFTPSGAHPPSSSC